MPKVNEIITQRIIDKIQQGNVAWQSPNLFNGGKGPMNYESKRQYSSINALLLADGECPFYLTFKQIQKLGGTIRKGAKSDIAVFWKITEYSDSNGKDKSFPLLRYYTVFNLKHVDNIAWQQDLNFQTRQTVNKIEAAEAIIAGYKNKPETRYTDPSCAYYSPLHDYVNIPAAEFIASDAAWYCLHFHEYAHSTGHKSRLNRELSGPTKRKEYSKEELIAEITTTFLANSCGLDQSFDNSVAYIQGWLKALKNDPNMIISAATQAQKAFDMILGNVKESQAQEEEAIAA